MKSPLLGLTLFALGIGAPLLAADPPSPSPASAWTAMARGRVEPAGGIVQVASGCDGIVQSVFAHEGDHVTRDTPLAALDSEGASLNLAVARAQLAEAQSAQSLLAVRQAAAEREVQRLAQLVDEHLANSQDLDQARDRLAEIKADAFRATAAIATANARVAVAEYDVHRCTVRAPGDGQIIRVLIHPGEAAGGQTTPLFWFAPDGSQVVIAQLDEDSVPAVKPGQAAEIVTNSTPSRTIAATVQRVGLIFGPRRPATDDPAERQDVRVVDCVVTLRAGSPRLLFGERVLVRFLRSAEPAR